MSEQQREAGPDPAGTDSPGTDRPGTGRPGMERAGVHRAGMEVADPDEDDVRDAPTGPADPPAGPDETLNPG